VNLTLAEFPELPLAAALFDGDDLLAQTPEWRGAGPGAVAFPARGRRLLVSTDATHPVCVPVVGRLLDEIDDLATALPRRQSLRATMLADSLRIVAGRGVSTSGTGPKRAHSWRLRFAITTVSTCSSTTRVSAGWVVFTRCPKTRWRSWSPPT